MQNKLVLLFFIVAHSTPALAQKTGAKWIKQESHTSKANSPHEAWRKEIFKGKTDQILCSTLSRGLKFDKIKDKVAIETIKSIQNGVAKASWRTLLPHFHPRLKVKRAMLENLFSEYTGTYGGDEFDVTPYRVWALNSPEGKVELTECKDDALSLRGFYGYPLQLGLLLQIAGKTEMGHAYVSLVPVKDKWLIGAWHKIQWTHTGKDAETWIGEAMELAEKKNKKAAFVKIDIATKLLDGGAFIYYQLRKDAEATRDSWLTQEQWLKYFQDFLPEEKIFHAGTALGEDGAGILLRILVDPKEAANKQRENCKNIGKKIYSEKWTQSLGGFKCQMVTEFEPKHREGVLGGNFFSAKDIRP